MVVYRRINKSEVDKYFNNTKIKGKEINSVLHGRSFGIYFNNHPYLYDQKYLHFFKDLVDARDYVSQIKSGVDSVVLAFEIPDKILKRFEGRGLYEFNDETVVAIEYALPDRLYKNDWIKSLVDENELISCKRKKVDYKEFGFGDISNSNAEIDKYIRDHTVKKREREI